MCGHTDWILSEWRSPCDGYSWRYATLLELSKENTNCCALPEISTRKVMRSNYNYICAGWIATTILFVCNWKCKINVNVFLFFCIRFSITFIHLPVGSKWLYVGTEKGNIHIVHTESFTLSGYIIHWNKAVEL